MRFSLSCDGDNVSDGFSVQYYNRWKTGMCRRDGYITSIWLPLLLYKNICYGLYFRNLATHNSYKRTRMVQRTWLQWIIDILWQVLTISTSVQCSVIKHQLRQTYGWWRGYEARKGKPVVKSITFAVLLKGRIRMRACLTVGRQQRDDIE